MEYSIMTKEALIFILAGIGISEAFYLLKLRLRKQKPVCVIGEKCNLVLESKYNSLFFGIPNELMGLAFYISVATLSTLLFLGIGQTKWLMPLTKIIVISGALFSIFLFYLQWKVIKAWCIRCLMSAATVFLMVLIVLL